MNKSNIIKLLSYEINSNDLFIENLKAYPNKIKSINDLEHIEGFTKDIKMTILNQMHIKTKIIDILKFLKSYNNYLKDQKKVKEYDEAILAIEKIQHYKQIKGLNKDIMNIINELIKTNKDSNKPKDKSSLSDKKKLITDHLEIIKNYNLYKNEIIKAKRYETAIENIKSATNLENLSDIKGVGTVISKMINELLKTGKIKYIEDVINKDSDFIKSKKQLKSDFNKKLILENLEIIRNYELFINNIDKAKVYSLAIGNIYKYPNDITSLITLKEIKGIGTAITFMLNELKNNGYISYIKNVINKNKSFTNKLIDHNINKEILIDNLELIKNYETYNNEPYKIRAYTNAIDYILIYPDDLKNIESIYKIEDIGERILEKIYELYLTGKIAYIEDNIKADKKFLFKQELLEIYGIGPKNAKNIIDAGICSLSDLRKNTKLLNNKQKIGLKYFDDLKKLIPLEEYERHVEIIRKAMPSKITFDFVGSYRRGSKTMGDIDLIIMENSKFNLSDYIKKLDKYIIETLALGNNKFMGIVKIGNNPARRFDILIAPVDEYYYSLLYFTGSKLFNIGLRHYVKTKFNLSLSEHGFLNKKIPVKSEEDIFKYLKLNYVKPINRNKFYL
jgi:DNA polymerase/3'-5' exonuclease PolX